MPFIFSRIFFVCLLFSPHLLAAAETVGEVVFVQGEASLISVSEAEPRVAAFGGKIYQMDTLQTGAGAELRVLFSDKTLLSLGSHSKVLVTEHLFRPRKEERRSLFDLLTGSVRVLVDEATSFRTNDVRFQTPTAVATVRGTDLGVRLLSRSTQFFCFDGLLETYFREEPEAKVMLRSGQYTEVKNAPPTPAGTIPPGLEKEFQSISEASDLREVLDQTGAVGHEVLEPEKEIARVADQPPPVPVVPQIIPGGETSTPEAAKPVATDGTMKVPIRFPGR